MSADEYDPLANMKTVEGNGDTVETYSTFASSKSSRHNKSKSSHRSKAEPTRYGRARLDLDAIPEDSAFWEDFAVETVLRGEELPDKGNMSNLSIVLDSILNAKQKAIDKAIKKFRGQQKASICFMMDCTGSMEEYIEEARACIDGIIARCELYGVRIVELAFVAYRDIGDGKKRFEVKNFTSTTPEFRHEFKNFIKKLDATGGDDGPEDVLGAFKQVMSLKWNPNALSRILVHIADYPAHGVRFHGGMPDDYPDGYREDPEISEISAHLRQHEIQYIFGRITSKTDQMITEFKKNWDVEVIDMKDASLMETAVASSVTTLVERTSSATMSSLAVRSPEELAPIRLDTRTPVWDRIKTVEGRFCSLELPSVSGIKEYVKPRKSEKKPIFLKIAEYPFAKGGERLAFHALRVFPDREIEDQKYVVKKFKKESYPRRYERSLEVQTVSALLAREFNKAMKLAGKGHVGTIKFLKGWLASVPKPSSKTNDYWFLEREFDVKEDGKFVKIMNNLFTAPPPTEENQALFDLAHAFVKFTFDVTGGYLVLSDIQGIITQEDDGTPKLLCTDPAIHCLEDELRFGATNLQLRGFQAYANASKESRFTDNELCKLPLAKLREENEALAEKEMAPTRKKNIKYCHACNSGAESYQDCPQGIGCHFVHVTERCMHGVLGGGERCPKRAASLRK